MENAQNIEASMGVHPGMLVYHPLPKISGGPHIFQSIFHMEPVVVVGWGRTLYCVGAKRSKLVPLWWCTHIMKIAKHIVTLFLFCQDMKINGEATPRAGVPASKPLKK